MTDNSAGQARTRQFLHRRLQLIDKGEHFMNRLRRLAPGKAARRYRRAHP
jgi:hypothetical protein